MTSAEIQTLIARAADGSLTAEEGASLAAACREDEAVLTALASQVSTERLLHAVERDPTGRLASQEIVLRLEQERLAAVSEPGFTPRVVGNVRRRVWITRLAAAAVLALLGVLGALLVKHSSKAPAPSFAADGPPSVPTESAVAVALLKRAVNVEWADAKSGPSVGSMLGVGWLKLRAGTVQVEFLGGARLLVVGPAELRMDSDSAVFLQSGKASAYVPEPARGFSLSAPGMDIVDLGTAFGVNVTPARPTEVHVFDGAVSLKTESSGVAGRKIEAGGAVEFANGKLQDIPVRPADFPNGEALARSAAAEARTRSKEWKAAMEALAADPATLLSYTFEGERESTRSVMNQSSQAITESHGALVGAGWTTGRWTGKHALEFRSRGDRLRFTIPGKHAALTLMAWVRVDSLPNDYNSLLMPSHYEKGSLHWTLERGGELRLTLRNTDTQKNGEENWDGPVSGPAVSNMDFGRWLFLATTYDAATGIVTHYRDGQQCGSAIFPHRLPVVLGPVEFGNWGADSANPDSVWTKNELPNRKTRNFVGRVDELNILSRAMTAAEISHFYAAGRP